MPDVAERVPERPTNESATAALNVLRSSFKTFPFADARMSDNPLGGPPIVDQTKPPCKDESAFLAALLTAVCRPSLHLAPGCLFRAPRISGAGSGKGLLGRCICIIAFGREPHAVTAGITGEESEKRIASELIEGGPVVFLDNLNNSVLKSDLLASAPHRQRFDGFRGSRPSLYRGGVRCANRRPGGKEV